METKKVKLKDLRDAPYNPRQISGFMLDKLKKSIKEFGVVEPVIVNKRTNHIVGGHMRSRALREMYGDDYEVDIVEVDLTEVQEKALNISLNKITGDWTEDKLIELVTNIERESEELLDVTGFSDSELELLLSQYKEFEPSKEDKITIADIKNTFVHNGDIFEIDGKHRIACGASSDPKLMANLLGNNKIDLVVTSPPYNADIKYGEYADNKDFNEYMKLMDAVYKNLREFLNKDRYIAVNIGDMTKANLTAHHSIILEKIGFKYARTIYWVKPEAAVGGVRSVPYPRWFRPRVNTESIVVYLNQETDKAPEYLGVILTYRDRERNKREKPDKTDATQIDPELMKQYGTNVWKMKPDSSLADDHPAPYPTLLADNCIKFYSLENEIVLDPFLGSGTTILSADKLKRRGYGIDLDAKSVEVSLRRFKQVKPDAEIKCLNRKVQVKW